MRRTGVVLLTACTLPLLAGCEFLTGVSEPEELHVVVESGEVNSVVMITSAYFLQIPNPECPEVCEPSIQLVQADTTVQALPFDGIYPFTSRQQYFVEVIPEAEQAVTLSMIVDIDGKVWFDDFRELAFVGDDGERETFRFIYTFGRAGSIR